MTNRSDEQLFYFSVIRLVPDPIRDEAINLGVAVVGRDGTGRIKATTNVKSRMRGLHASKATTDLKRALDDLAEALGLSSQLQLVPVLPTQASKELLDEYAASLNNQLQMTRSRQFVAPTLAEAVQRLFHRYVGSREERPASDKPLTHAQMRQQVWRVVRNWSIPGTRIEQNGLIDGTQAQHPADIIFRNGHDQAAMIVLSTHPDEQHLAYLYRDSLPTIARDMHESFKLFAILPAPILDSGPRDEKFIAETQRLLTSQQINTVSLDRVPEVKETIIEGRV